MSVNPLRSFADNLSLSLSDAQYAQLDIYASCVWEKKDSLNLTSVDNLAEIYNRHLADGLVAAAQIKQLSHLKKWENFTLADMGSGAGYIGFTLAVALPQAHVTCVESLEKRCAFMNWALFKTGLPNLKIQKARLGQQPLGNFEVVTERAMGTLPDILPLCMSAVKPGGIFLAYQGQIPQLTDLSTAPDVVLWDVKSYELPCPDNKKRHLVFFERKA